MDPGVERYFLIIGNGRTGSTWLLTSLDRLNDVRARRELKWSVAGQPVHPMHVLWDRNTPSAQALIDHACAGTPTRCTGSKLIFDPYWFMGEDVLDAIASAIEPQVGLILLKRSYVETWLSWKARGVAHEVDLSQSEGADRVLVETSASLKGDLRDLVLHHEGRPLAAGDGEPYPLVDAVEDLLMAFANDLQMARLVTARGGMVLDYREIEPRLGEVARFVGSAADAAEIERVRRRPLMKKLPSLYDRLKPLAPLQTISACLEAAVARAATTGEAASCWQWNSDGALITVPGLRAALQQIGVETSSDGETIYWSPRRPVLHTEH